jgi:hypothetical protein
VQLAWSVHPIDSARIGYLPVFSKAVLYPLRGLRQGRAWYAYRLGFFDSVEAAQQMASPLREHYAAVVIVPAMSLWYFAPDAMSPRAESGRSKTSPPSHRTSIWFRSKKTRPDSPSFGNSSSARM